MAQQEEQKLSEQELVNSEMQLEEKYAREPVPHSIRRSWVRTAAIYSGMCASISYCMSGGSLISGLGLWSSILALTLGVVVLILCFFLPMGKIGSKHGYNTYIIGESAFGSIGANITTGLVITSIPCICWYGIQVTIAAQAVAAVFGLGSTGLNVVTVFFGLLFVVPTLYGTKSMAWLNYVSIPLMVFILIYGLVRSLGITGAADLSVYTPPTNMSLMWGINIQVGMLACGAAFVADYTRWQKDSVSGIIKAGAIGIYPFSLVLTVVGMVMAISAVNIGVDDPWNVVSVMMALGMPSFAMLLIFLLQWTTGVTSIYSSSLALAKFFGGKRWVWSFVAAVIGIALSISGIINYFLTFLGILAAWLSPVVGVIIAEYFIVAKGELRRRKGIYWPGIISWLAGGAVGWVSTFFIPAVNAMIVSGLLYVAYHALFAKDAFRKQGGEMAETRQAL